MLWQAAWKAWLSVREGTRRLPPQSHADFLRQPLYLNPDIKRMDGFPLGSERMSLFRRWSQLGINRVVDIWDGGRDWFRDAQDLWRKTRSRDVVTMRSEVISTIPSGILQSYKPQAGDWVFTEDQ